jgi:hypothetical protein
MKFTTQNQKEIDVVGTSLVGHIKADYKTLKKLFGKPLDGDQYKTDAEWELEFEDGSVATIYNYKSGKKYLGSSGLPKTKITNWHIGGFDSNVITKIQMLIGEFEELEVCK